MNQFCQSCGMPMRKDPKNGGSNADGSTNAEYCSYCYANGAFITLNFTAQQMQAFCVQKMQEQGVVKPLAWLLTRGIPKLKRWKTP